MSLFPRFMTHELRPFMRIFEDPLFSAIAQQSNNSNGSGSSTGRMFQPSFDVREGKNSYYLDGEVPGINDKSKLDIHFTDAQTLVVRGHIERSYSSGETPVETGAEKSSRNPTVEDESSAVATTGESAITAKEESVNKIWVSERMVGEFQRSFSFPGSIDQDAVKASLKDGILSIVVPKRELKNPRKINVE